MRVSQDGYPLDPARKASLSARRRRSNGRAVLDVPAPPLGLAIRYQTRPDQNRTDQILRPQARQAAQASSSSCGWVLTPPGMVSRPLFSRLPKGVSDRMQGKGWLGWISMTRLNLSDAWDLPVVRRCVLLQPAPRTRRCGNRCESRFGC